MYTVQETNEICARFCAFSWAITRLPIFFEVVVKTKSSVIEGYHRSIDKHNDSIVAMIAPPYVCDHSTEEYAQCEIRLLLHREGF